MFDHVIAVDVLHEDMVYTSEVVNTAHSESSNIDKTVLTFARLDALISMVKYCVCDGGAEKSNGRSLKL